VTAASLPSGIAPGLEVQPKPAPSAPRVSDFMSEALRSGRTRSEAVLHQLELIERAFGRHFFDPRARPAVEAARVRATRLATATGSVSESIAISLASDLFVALAVERSWRTRDARDVLTAVAHVIDRDPDSVATDILTLAFRAPQLLELPPNAALEVQLSMLVTFGPVVEASIWVRDGSGRISCALAAGETATTRRFRATAMGVLERQLERGNLGTITGVAIRRWQVPWAALVARLRTRGSSDALLEEAAAAISIVLERDFLLGRNAARERSLVTATERRLSRLGFDLHDGALQYIAALTADVRSLRPGLDQAVGARVEAIDRRLQELDHTLRELAHSLEPASLMRRPLERVLASEAASLTERTGIEVRANVIGDFTTMTQSQKIALIRVVQEGFTNIREHSNATVVDVAVTASRSCVEAKIEDNGDGFEVARTLQDAAQRGRLGLVGGSERIRLLGGTFDIRSRPGGPTTVTVTLPRWQPVAADESTLQFAY
jgi:signal transduction histidine kinase